MYLHKELEGMSRQELEDHITAKRARRLAAAVVYHEGRNLKLNTLADKLSRRLTAQFTMLAKELDSADKALAKIDKRLISIEAMKAEIGLTRDQIVILDKEANDED